jgi:hypothetical protein
MEEQPRCRKKVRRCGAAGEEVSGGNAEQADGSGLPKLRDEQERGRPVQADRQDFIGGEEACESPAPLVR